MSKHIVILGGRGMLGTDVNQCCTQRGLPTTVYDLPEFDLCNEQHIAKAVRQGDIIINCAAYTNVEKAESEKDLACRVNSQAVGFLGQAAKQAGVPVIHISTDFVFDGTLDRPYRETDQTNPISVYGASKLDGEKQLSASGCTHCIVRVQWTYGHAGTNFVKKIIKAAETRDTLSVIDDQIGSPTATTEAARVLCDLVEMNNLPEDVFHLAAGGYVSRYEMTQFIFNQLGINTTVNPCRTSDFKTVAQRPLNSRFDCTKIETLLKRTMRPWTEPLKEFLETL